MTTEQIDICNYLNNKYKGCRYELVDQDKVKVINPDGKEMIFSYNDNDDIIYAENETNLPGSN